METQNVRKCYNHHLLTINAFENPMEMPKKCKRKDPCRTYPECLGKRVCKACQIFYLQILMF